MNQNIFSKNIDFVTLNTTELSESSAINYKLYYNILNITYLIVCKNIILGDNSFHINFYIFINFQYFRC